jgi:hypothetical protein
MYIYILCLIDHAFTLKPHLDISIMYPLHILTNTKKIISKGLSKIKSNFNPSKVHNYHVVKVFQKMISHLTLSLHSSTHFNPYKQFEMKFNMNFLIS